MNPPVFQICRHVITCDDRQAVLTTTMVLLTTGSFCWVCDFLDFENRSIIEGDMTKNVQVGKNALLEAWSIATLGLPHKGSPARYWLYCPVFKMFSSHSPCVPIFLYSLVFLTRLVSKWAIQPVAVHRGVMMADTLSFNAKIGVVDFWVKYEMV